MRRKAPISRFTDLVIDENGKKTEEEIAALGVRCKGYPSDASDFAATEAVVEEIKKDFGRIDVLVVTTPVSRWTVSCSA